jgi:hypothetical protein
MTQREKELLSGIYDCAKTLGTLTPKNPMDLQAIAHNLSISVKGADQLTYAISALGFGDHESCAEYIAECKAVLSVHAGGKSDAQ